MALRLVLLTVIVLVVISVSLIFSKRPSGSKHPSTPLVATNRTFPSFVNSKGVVLTVTDRGTRSEEVARFEDAGFVSSDYAWVSRDLITIQFPTGIIEREIQTFGSGMRRPQVGDTVNCRPHPGSTYEIEIGSPSWPSSWYIGT